MGKQINFYLLAQDQLKIEEYLTQKYLILGLYSTTYLPTIFSNLAQKDEKNDFFKRFLLQKQYLDILVLEFVKNGGILKAF